ncbi:MAG: NAD(P)H-dependent oxidoreductase [Erythrobacter sp.]|jgi:NAD(P)H dehydrogenase (quinone)
MKYLVVIAHPEPTSFNGALLRHATSALVERGHEVVVSDLYAMGFDPVTGRGNFLDPADSQRFDQQAEERIASANGSFAPELQAEMDKLAWCDVLVLQFPLYWMGMPAMLKGWIDRVFAIGCAYGGGHWFDRGLLGGRRAMLALTVGGTSAAYSPQGLYGLEIAQLLEPIQRGVLGFAGFDVVEPYIAHAPSRVTREEREAMLDSYARRLIEIREAPVLPMPVSADYEGFVRKAQPSASVTAI